MKKQLFHKNIFFFLFWVFFLFGDIGQDVFCKEIDSLMVYGEDFTFFVDEPEEWQGDIKRAKEYKCNIIFYKSWNDLQQGGPVVQVTVYTKKDEDILKDLLYDISQYRKSYSNLKEKEEDGLKNVHKKYQFVSKLVFVENSFFQYIVYLNPGTSFKDGLSVAMNIAKRPATKDELRAFKKIISSLEILNVKVKK